jgi:hypothetical protein
MINFYIGTLLLSGLAYNGTLHGTDGSQSSEGIAWSTEAVENGLEVIIGNKEIRRKRLELDMPNLFIGARLRGDDYLYGPDDQILWTSGFNRTGN